MKVYDTCQFEYDPKNKTLYVKEHITDEEKCSYEGLMKIIKDHFPDRLTEYMKLINHYYLVQPAMMRPFTLAYKDGKKVGSAIAFGWFIWEKGFKGESTLRWLKKSEIESF